VDLVLRTTPPFAGFALPELQNADTLDIHGVAGDAAIGSMRWSIAVVERAGIARRGPARDGCVDGMAKPRMYLSAFVRKRRRKSDVIEDCRREGVFIGSMADDGGLPQRITSGWYVHAMISGAWGFAMATAIGTKSRRRT
jgi:hypothetical protein